jgi:hypothetical protein
MLRTCLLRIVLVASLALLAAGCSGTSSSTPRDKAEQPRATPVSPPGLDKLLTKQAKKTEKAKATPASRPEPYGGALSKPILMRPAAPKRPLEKTPVIEVKPNDRADEVLFLVYVLKDLYSKWPKDSDPEQVTRTLRNLRHEAKRHLQYVRDRRLDKHLETLFEDYVSCTDAVSDFLAELGSIERLDTARTEQEQGQAGFRAGFAGGYRGAEAYNGGASAGEAAAVALLISALNYVVEESKNQARRNEAKRRALDKAVRRLEDKVSTNLARTQDAVVEMESKHGWQKGEAGFHATSEEEAEISRLIEKEDISGLLAIAESQRKRRPRDPFLSATRCLIESYHPYYKPGELADLAKECVSAASWVPAGARYDLYRGWILAVAGDIANRASTKELKGQSWAKAFNDNAAYAVRIWDACLHYTPDDSTGEFRERRAWVLMQCGELDKALEQAVEIQAQRKGTWRYAYNMACLYSALGNTTDSLEWLDHAIRKTGFENIKIAWSEPDLERLRREKGNGFYKLVEVRIGWTIRYGVLNDDILVKNNSAFALTNVKFKVHIESGTTKIDRELTADRIDPGQTYEWVDAVSIPNSRYDKAGGTFICDQRSKPLTD